MPILYAKRSTRLASGAHEAAPGYQWAWKGLRVASFADPSGLMVSLFNDEPVAAGNTVGTSFGGPSLRNDVTARVDGVNARKMVDTINNGDPYTACFVGDFQDTMTVTTNNNGVGESQTLLGIAKLGTDDFTIHGTGNNNKLWRANFTAGAQAAVAWASDGTDGEIWTNGIFHESISSINAPGSTTPGNVTNRFELKAANNTTGGTCAFLVWDRVLSDHEFRSITSDPYGPFRPAPAGASAGSGFDTSGSFTELVVQPVTDTLSKAVDTAGSFTELTVQPVTEAFSGVHAGGSFTELVVQPVTDQFTGDGDIVGGGGRARKDGFLVWKRMR